MDNEIAMLLEKTVVDRVDTVVGEEYYVGTLCGQPVVITRAGIGNARLSVIQDEQTRQITNHGGDNGRT